MLQHNQITLALRLTLEEDVLARHTPASPRVVGESLATEIQAYTQRERTGYFPPVDFFERQGGLDPDLLETLNSITWLCAQLARNEVLTKLRPVFSQIQIEAIQCTAFAMPSVRPNAPHAFTKLVDHYTPDTVKMDIRLSMLQKHTDQGGLDRFARQVVYRWLKESFALLEITGSKIV